MKEENVVISMNNLWKSSTTERKRKQGSLLKEGVESKGFFGCLGTKPIILHETGESTTFLSSLSHPLLQKVQLGPAFKTINEGQNFTSS